MGSGTSKKIFPKSFKTVGIDHWLCDPVQGTGVNSAYSFIGFQVYQPYNLYAVTGLKVRLRMLFASTVPTAEAIIYKIAVGSDGVYSYDIDGFYPSSTARSVVVNYAPGSSELDVTIDLKNLITPTGDNIIYFFFPAVLAPVNPNWNGNYSQININILKVDMSYQVLGIR